MLDRTRVHRAFVRSSRIPLVFPLSPNFDAWTFKGPTTFVLCQGEAATNEEVLAQERQECKRERDDAWHSAFACWCFDRVITLFHLLTATSFELVDHADQSQRFTWTWKCWKAECAELL